MFLRGTPIGIHCTARQDGERLEFEAATGPAGPAGSAVGPQLVRSSATQGLAPNSSVTIATQCPTGAALLSWGFDTGSSAVSISSANRKFRHRSVELTIPVRNMLPR